MRIKRQTSRGPPITVKYFARCDLHNEILKAVSSITLNVIMDTIIIYLVIKYSENFTINYYHAIFYEVCTFRLYT